MASAPQLELPPGYLGLPLRTPTLPPAEHTNCYVVGREQALVVDPGTPHDRELERLRERLFRLLGEGGSLAAILLTHHHSDHIGGAARLARDFDLPVWAHPETLARLPALGTPGAVRSEPLLGERTLVVDGARTIRTVHTPGHAPGHLCLFEPAARALIGGDMVPGIGTTLIDPPEGDMAAYLAGLGTLAALDPLAVLPAHGPVLRPGRAKIEALIAHRLEREQKVVAALGGEPRPLAEVAAEAYAELPLVFAALGVRSTLAHLYKLRDEGRAEEPAEGRWRRGGSS